MGRAWETLKDLQGPLFGIYGRILESFKQKNMRFSKDHTVCSFDSRPYGVTVKQEDQNKATSINQTIVDSCLDQECGDEGNEK